MDDFFAVTKPLTDAAVKLTKAQTTSVATQTAASVATPSAGDDRATHNDARVSRERVPRRPPRPTVQRVLQHALRTAKALLEAKTARQLKRERDRVVAKREKLALVDVSIDAIDAELKRRRDEPTAQADADNNDESLATVDIKLLKGLRDAVRRVTAKENELANVKVRHARIR